MPLSQLRPGMQCTGYSVIRGTDDQLVRRRDRRRPLGRRVGQRRPAILIRVSGPAVDRTGVGPASRARRSTATGRTPARSPRRSAIRRQDRAGDADRGDPLQPARRAAREADRAPIARRARAAAGRAADGLRPERRDRRAAGARGRAAPGPARARRPHAAAHPVPGRPAAAGLGDERRLLLGRPRVGAVGTVAYVDGDRVWGFGHPFENSGLRSLLLQDAYVYTVISNPNAGDDTGSTYKLAAVGHDLGTISNDASAAVVAAPARRPDHPGADLQPGRRHRQARHALRERGRRDRRGHADRQLPRCRSSGRSRSPRAPRRSCAARPAS